MKTIRVTILSVFLLGAVSCSDSFLDINNDPINTTSPPVGSIFLAASVQGAYVLGGDINRTASLWTQHLSSSNLSSIQLDRYTNEVITFNNHWYYFYVGVLPDLREVIARSDELPNYRAQARILRTYFYHVMTDLWGDIPYTEAVQGDQGQSSPEYDDQEAIYSDLLSELDLALAEFDRSEDAIIMDNGYDLFYNGNLDLWEKFANSLKLKILMRQSEIDANAGTTVQTFLNSNPELLRDLSEDAFITFFDNSVQQHPLYQLATFDGNDVCASSTLVDLMTLSSDPRTDVYFTSPGGSIVAADNGTSQDDLPTNLSRIAETFASADSDVRISSAWENSFFLAEAAARGWYASESDEDLYNEAIELQMTSLGIDPADIQTYLVNVNVDYPEAGTLDQKLQAIATQKYIALFTRGAELFAEYRRLDGPAILIPATDNVNNSLIPVRFPYPNSEESTNSQNIPNETYNDKVYWDEE